MTTRAAVMNIESLVDLMKESCEEFLALPLFADYDDEEREVLDALVKKFCVIFTRNLIQETTEMKGRHSR